MTHRRSGTFAAVAVFSLTVPVLAYAQSNLLVIEQTGASNTLSVDQSNASDSAVGGLRVLEADPRVGTLDLDAIGVARQDGDGNVATVVLGGDGANAGLSQSGSGNIANITGGGSSQSGVSQVGSGNRATVNVTGNLGSRGMIEQVGNGNTGRVDVAGGSRGTLVQEGDDNDRSLSVDGGADITFTQIGSGLTDATSNAAIASAVAAGATGLPTGVQVISNATSVQITQTALPGLGTGK